MKCRVIERERPLIKREGGKEGRTIEGFRTELDKGKLRTKQVNEIDFKK